MMDSKWLDQLVRRVALDIVGARQFKGLLACTSFDPTTHTVKGTIVPHGIETGSIPLMAIQTSMAAGTGIFIGPRPGNASVLQNGGKFEGDLLDIEFDMGDPNTIIAKHRMSQPQNPPQVQAGEMLHLHEKGTKTLHAQDGSVTFTHFAKQATETWDAQGNRTVDTKGQAHTVKAGGSTVQMTGSQVVTDTATKIFTKVVHLGAGGSLS